MNKFFCIFQDLDFSGLNLDKNVTFKIQSDDLDESGKITAVEFSDWMEKHGRVMDPDGIRLMIDAFDENDDEQIGKIKKCQN